jgi:hypothetical protein
MCQILAAHYYNNFSNFSITLLQHVQCWLHTTVTMCQILAADCQNIVCRKYWTTVLSSLTFFSSSRWILKYYFKPAYDFYLSNCFKVTIHDPFMSCDTVKPLSLYSITQLVRKHIYSNNNSCAFGPFCFIILKSIRCREQAYGTIIWI